MTGENLPPEAGRDEAAPSGRGAHRRSRGTKRGEPITVGVAAIVVIAAGAIAAVAMSGSSSTPPVRQVADVRTTHTPPERSPKATAKPNPTHKPKPTPSPTPSPVAQVQQPTPAAPATTEPAAVPTSTYQQDCYAGPHPTCTPAPAPSWLRTQTYIPTPFPTGRITPSFSFGKTPQR